MTLDSEHDRSAGAGTIVGRGTTTPRTLAEAAPESARARFSEAIRYVRGRGALEIAIIFVFLQVCSFIAYYIWPDDFPYLSSANIELFSRSVPVIALLAMGAGILMIAGEFDLSIGSIYTLSAIVFLTWYGGGNNPVLAIAIGIAVGVACGLLNGFITTTFQIPSFIVTLGAVFWIEGAATWYTDNSPAIIQRGEGIGSVFAGEFLGQRSPAYWLLGIGVICWVLMHRHRLGNHIFAVGGNEAAARAISVNPKRIKLIAFAIMGALTAFAGILTAVRVETMQPGTGKGLELDAIAAAVVGGTALRGGKGSVLGMVIGAALIFWIQDVILLSGVASFYYQTFLGIIIVLAAISNRLFERRAA